MSDDAARAYAEAIPSVGKLDVEAWKLPAWDERYAKTASEKLRESTLFSYHSCPRYMLERGFPKPFLAKYEIGFDRESNRVTFPVRSDTGSLIGFTRRSLEPNADFRYLHDFQRNEVLYMLHRVPKWEPLVVTEGTVDVLMARLRAEQWTSLDGRLSVALGNAVGSFGSLTPAQATLLLTTRAPELIYLGYDNDAAGIANTKKAIKVLREAGAMGLRVLSFPAEDLGAMGLDTDDENELSSVESSLWLLKQPKTSGYSRTYQTTEKKRAHGHGKSRSRR